MASWYFLIDAKYVKGDGEVADVKLVLLADDLKKLGERHLATAIAQFYKLVCPGLILTKHIFRGLERPLYCDGDMEADVNKLIYSRKPSFDYEWSGGSNGQEIQRDAPENSVFVVIVSPNINHQKEFPEVAGWIDHWNWVKQDNGLSEAPINWVDRYETKLWSQE